MVGHFLFEINLLLSHSEVSIRDDWCKKLDNVETVIYLMITNLEYWYELIRVTLLLVLDPCVLNAIELQDALGLQGWW